MFGALTSAVDGLAEIDLGAFGDSELREIYVTIRRDIDRQEAFAARLLACVHGRGIPGGDGASSTPAWSQWKTGQRTGEARASLDAGKALDRLPLTAKAWAQGEISASAGRAICRGQRSGHEDTYAGIEEMLVGCAARRDLRSLDAMISHFHTRADALDDIEPAELNGVHLSRVANRWSLTGDLDALAGTTIDEAIRAATDKPDDCDVRNPAKRRADALTRVARFFLDHGDTPIEGGERPHITLVSSWEDARAGLVEPFPSLLCDTPFAPADIRRLLCDARITRLVLGANGIPLAIGQATYTPSPALRRAVVIRDHHCRFPGCDRRASWSEVHHVTAWPEGPTVIHNLALLCSYHHHLVHKPGWRNTFDGDVYTVYNRDGLVGRTRAPPGST